MAKSILTITVADDLRLPAQVAEDLFVRPSNASTFRSALDRYLKGVLTGQIPTSVAVNLIEATTASPSVSITITVDQSELTDGDSITIGTLTFTWKTSASTNVQVAIGSSDSEAATNLKDKMNAHPAFRVPFHATVSGNVVTLTLYASPSVGTYIDATVSETNAGATTLSAASFTASGANAVSDADPVSYSRGV